MEKKACYYRLLVGVTPDRPTCDKYHPDGCDDCIYYMPTFEDSEDSKVAQNGGELKPTKGAREICGNDSTDSDTSYST